MEDMVARRAHNEVRRLLETYRAVLFDITEMSRIKNCEIVRVAEEGREGVCNRHCESEFW
jgi:hypothetical protein